jgi:hypothetical protein
LVLSERVQATESDAWVGDHRLTSTKEFQVVISLEDGAVIGWNVEARSVSVSGPIIESIRVH